MPAPSPAGAQAPGFHRLKVGDIEVTLVHDGAATRPLEQGFVRNADLGDVQAALAAAFQPTDTITIPFTPTVINTGQHLVAIDFGMGDMGPPGTGLWAQNLEASGYRLEDIDTVVLSHFHGDHINGLRAKDGAFRLPNAKRVLVPALEWAFWTDEARAASAPEGLRPAFAAVGRVLGPLGKDGVETFSGAAEIVPGITALPTPGHTPGHTSFLVESGSERLLIWSDVSNKPELFARNPGWHAAFDLDPREAEATRRRMLDMAATERLRVAGFHFPFPATGYIGREGDGYRFVPAFWRAT